MPVDIMNAHRLLKRKRKFRAYTHIEYPFATTRTQLGS
jgi:hypothetical protein